MSQSEMEAELERLRAENAQLKKKEKIGISLKVSEKGAVSLYGMGRFPVTLYKEQWLRILTSAPEIEAFIHENVPQITGRRTPSSAARKRLEISVPQPDFKSYSLV
jgi:hypothetical protein